MNIQILAERKALALIEIQKVAGKIGEKFSVPDELLTRLTQSNKDRDVEAMQRIEAVADLLNFLVDGSGETETKSEVPFILDMNVKQISKAVAEMDNESVLKELLKEENEGSGRKTVISAIEARIAELSTPQEV